MDEHGIWSENQSVNLEVFPDEFTRRFGKDPNVTIRQAIPLSRDISRLNNECLTLEVTGDEILKL